MKARRQITLEELFRFYPQLRLTTQSEAAQQATGQDNESATAAACRQAGEPVEV